MEEQKTDRQICYINTCHKNVSARGRVGISATASFYFGTPFISPKLNRARKLKFGTLVAT